MKLSVLHFALILSAIFLFSTPTFAQQKRISPHETISSVIDGGRVIIVYGRPYTKDPKTGDMRKIWGGLIPYGKVWRTGSDEATLFITQQTLGFGDVTVPPGAYTLYTLPTDDGAAKLIINKQLGQWGTKYDEKQDLARVDLKKDDIDPQVDQFTIAIEKNPAGGGVLKLTWEKTQYSVPFTVKK